MERSGFYRGSVVSVADPEGLYRIRVTCPQLTGGSVLGWVAPMMGSTTGVPNVGDQVWVAFEGGDVNFPLYLRGDMLTPSSLNNRAVTDGTALDLRTPAAPTGLSVTSVVYADTAGTLQGRVTASWSAVTAATDGTAMIIGYYELWGRTGGGDWGQITASTATTVTWAPFSMGANWEFMVRAAAASSPALGQYSATVAHTISSDISPTLSTSTLPSNPALSSAAGLVTVTWDGMNSASPAVAMPSGVVRVDVAMGLSSNPTTVYGSLTAAGKVTGAFTATSGTPVYAAIRSVDKLGTASAWVPGTIALSNAIQDSVTKLTNAVVIDSSAPSVTITNGATSPNKVVITDSALTFYNTGQQVAYIDNTVQPSGYYGKMGINNAQISHHLITAYDANTTIVKFVS